MAVLALIWAIIMFWIPPRFSRKRLVYELELSTPLLHESAHPDSNLIVKYGNKRYAKRTLKDPHIARIRLPNIGRREVRSADFDQGTPLQLDVGVKIVAILRVICSLNDMPDPKVGVSERRLNIFPSLIPRHSSIHLIILLDGPCAELTHKSPLMDVSFGQAKVGQRNQFINPRVLGWLASAFIVWWVIQEPLSAAHLVHDIGALLSAAARGVSNFVASI
jgi:hypothetical protein